MTEADWTAATQPDPMLKYLGKAADKRRLRLFGTACCRRVWKWISAEVSRSAVERAELFADGQIKRSELIAVRSAAHALVRDSESTPAEYVASAVAMPTFRPHWVAHLARATFWRNNYYEYRTWDRVDASEMPVQADLLRDIFGNPFRPVAFLPAWRSSIAVALAESMYAARDFGPMPVLADALEEAGCDSADVLAHCRGDGQHVRGCWVVDLVRGKSCRVH